MSDYTHIRQSEDCPLCHKVKDVGLVVCWDCYKEHGFRNGVDYLITETLEKADAYIGRGGSVPLHWGSK